MTIATIIASVIVGIIIGFILAFLRVLWKKKREDKKHEGNITRQDMSVLGGQNMQAFADVSNTQLSEGADLPERVGDPGDLNGQTHSQSTPPVSVSEKSEMDIMREEIQKEMEEEAIKKLKDIKDKEEKEIRKRLKKKLLKELEDEQ